MDYSLPGSSIHGIFQARVLEWVAISCSIFKAHAKKLNLKPTPSLEMAKKKKVGFIYFFIFNEYKFVFSGKECCDQLVMPVFGTE